MFQQSTTKELSKMIEDVPRINIKKSAKYRTRGNLKLRDKIKMREENSFYLIKFRSLELFIQGQGRTSKIKSNNRVGK